MEAQAIPQELQISKLKAITTNLQSGAEDDKEFERRLKVAELALKEKDIKIKEKSSVLNLERRDSEKQAEQQLLSRIMK